MFRFSLRKSKQHVVKGLVSQSQTQPGRQSNFLADLFNSNFTKKNIRCFGSSSNIARGEYFDDITVKDGVAIIRIDGPQKMNVIDDKFRSEIEELWMKEIDGNSNVKAAVLISSKKDNFIAGADIKMIDSVEDKSTLKDICMKGHETFKKIRASKIPIVAAIDGSCLGGGLEVALYSDYRILTTNPKTILGLPEVKLGLLPGFGGTQNLRPIVGLQEALKMTLQGGNVRPDKAKKTGLADLVVDPAALESVAISSAKHLADGSLKIKRRKKSLVNTLLEDNPLGRMIVFDQTSKMLKKVPQYPAPPKILECIKYGIDHPKEKALEFEAQTFSELADTNESASLRGIFTGTQLLKSTKYGKPEKNPETVAILGAGLMGAGIAQVSAEKGYKVLLKDRDMVGAGKGMKYIGDNFDTKIKKRRMTKYKADATLSKIVPLTDDDINWTKHMGKADLVIEAVFEDINLKHKVLKGMEEVLPSHAVFASNTSAIPIAQIAEASQRPDKVVGMHYFSPVPMMPLLEIIPHKGTSDDTVAAALAVGNKQGKTVIVVGDVPGFYVNRCLGPYLAETTFLIDEGVDLVKLDKAMKSYGFPVGPVTLADEVGVDVASHVQSFLTKADLGVRMTAGKNDYLGEMMKGGLLGKKTGKGFYIHGKKKGPKEVNPEAKKLIESLRSVTEESKLSVEDIQNRMASRFVNEAMLCLQDDIIASPVDGDIGAIFGVGFPPFLGGPFRYVDHYGAQKYVDLLNGFKDKYGEQFTPAPILVDYAQAGKKFHN